MHFVSKSCVGEFCGMCYRAEGRILATHKVGEEILHDDPNQNRHNYTQYVCCEHFKMIFGEWTHEPPTSRVDELPA